MQCKSIVRPGRRHRILLARSPNTRLRSLLADLQCTREVERGEIIRVLHDELLSRLARINLDLGELRRGRRGGADEFARSWSSAAQHLAEAIHIVGRTRTELRPAMLEHCGLEAAMQRRTSEWSKRQQSRCDFIGSKVARPVVPAVALELFRLFEDTLTGLTQTCRPIHLIVRLTMATTTLNLEFRTRAVATNGFRPLIASTDMLAVRERVRCLRGKLVMQQRAALNVCVAVSVPLQS